MARKRQPRATAPAPYPAGLQWSRANDGAETMLGVTATPDRGELQWSRANDGAETTEKTGRSVSRQNRFNGAAPMMARKHVAGRHRHPDELASMEPRQ